MVYASLTHCFYCIHKGSHYTNKTHTDAFMFGEMSEQGQFIALLKGI